MSDGSSYHGQPILKRPVWTWEIPCYFFAGGLAGASSGLAWLAGMRGNHVLARRAWVVALTGVGVSPPLLIADLGRPERFLNMLRMFKVTSPMSVGSWVLATSGPSVAVATLSAHTGRLPRVGLAAGPTAALAGLPLATYTGALLANTAVPVWHDARRELPFVFGAGAALSAGAACAAVTPTAAGAPARRLALGAAATELVAKRVMEQRLGESGEPYRNGDAAKFSRISTACIVAGATLMGARGSRSRAATVGAGALLLAGAFAERWSVYRAGQVSAADPRYVVGPQRRRVEQREGARA
jgi:formate-dependent nitrite reductase membrane component NrfD